MAVAVISNLARQVMSKRWLTVLLLSMSVFSLVTQSARSGLRSSRLCARSERLGEVLFDQRVAVCATDGS